MTSGSFHGFIQTFYMIISKNGVSLFLDYDMASQVTHYTARDAVDPPVVSGRLFLIWNPRSTSLILSALTLPSDTLAAQSLNRWVF